MDDDRVEIIEPDSYIFLFEEPDNGWWLKIDNANDLINYHMKTASVYAETLGDYGRHMDEYKKDYNGSVFESRLTHAIVMYAEQNNISMVDACMQFRMKIASQQIYDIHKNGYIVINKNGGYHSGPIEYSQFVRRKTFTWPDFKESDIRIKRWEGGTHFYVFIGDMELHMDGQVKWMSESDARIAAMKYINKEDK